MSAFSTCSLSLLAFIVLVEKSAFCFAVVSKKRCVFFSLPDFKIFCHHACVSACIHACACVFCLSYLGFMGLFELCIVFNKTWKILSHYSFKCCCYPILFHSLVTRMWDFLTMSHTFLCFVLFSFFFYSFFSLNFSFRSKYPKVWIFSIGPVWVPLIVSLLLAAFLLKTSNKFLILYFSIIECQFDYFSVDSKTVEIFHLFIHLFLSSCF